MINLYNFIILDVKSMSTVFLNQQKFLDINTANSPVSYLVAPTVYNIDGQQITSNFSVQLYFNKLANADQPLCGFWDTNISDWSTVGCRLQENTLNGLFQCTCIHTTFFALIGVSI